MQVAVSKGAGDQGVQKVRRFKQWLAAGGTQQEIVELEGGALKECKYDLEKIHKLVIRLLKKLEQTG